MALYKAVSDGDYHKTKELLKSGISPNIIVEHTHHNIGIPILHYAIKKDQYKIAKLLLKKGATPNFKTRFESCSYLQSLLVSREHKYAQLLLKFGADPNYLVQFGHYNPLYLTSNRYSTLKLILKNGVNYDLIDNYHDPIYYHISYYHTNLPNSNKEDRHKILNLLLKYRTDLHEYFKFTDDITVTRLLLKYKNNKYIPYLKQYFCNDLTDYITKFC